jgi:glutamyl-tRNA reductase|tara:strand:- start:2 stop:424 length:423 start_codon:yes stop_codon:yes gene_type:complete
MVVKASTKKRLMDLGCPRRVAHVWADDRRWYKDIVPMNFDDIMNIFMKPTPTVFIVQDNRVMALDENMGEYIYEIVEKIRENELDRVITDYPEKIDGVVEKYIEMLENFGQIPAGSPYSYLREKTQNFINWNSLPWGDKQ